MDGSEDDISIITCADDPPGDADNFELPNYVVADERTDPSSILALKSAYVDLKNRWNSSQKENNYFRKLYSLNMNRSQDQGREAYKVPMSEYVQLSSSAQGAAAMPECAADSRSLASQIMYLEHQLKQVALERQKLEVETFQFRTEHGHLERKLKDSIDLDEKRCQHIQKQDQEIKALKSTVAELEGRLKKMEIIAETKHQFRVLEDQMAAAKILEYGKSDMDSPGYIKDLSSCNDALQLLEEAVRQQYSVIDAVRRQMAAVTTDEVPISPRPEAVGSSSLNLFHESTTPKHGVVAEHDGLVGTPKDTSFKPLALSWVKGQPCQLSDGTKVSETKQSKPSKEILYSTKSNNSHQAQVTSSDTATAEVVPSSSAHNRESKNERTKSDVLKYSENSERATKVAPNNSSKGILRPRSYDSSSSDSNASNNHKLVAKALSEASAVSNNSPKTKKHDVRIRKNQCDDPKGKERTPPPDATETALTVQLCPLCTEDFSSLTMEEFQNHVFNCFVKGDESERPTTAANNDHICPMCSAIFPEQVPQEEFEAHVQQHFEGRITDRFEILPSPDC